MGKVVCGCGLDSRHAKRVGMAGCALLLCGCTLALQTERSPAGDARSSGGDRPSGWPTIAPVSSKAQLAAFACTYGLGYGAAFALVQVRVRARARAS